MIEVKNLFKSFGDKLILSDLSFSIQESNIVCIIGKSGAGKSTLLRCITGLDNNYQGDIYIDGQNISEFLKTHRVGLVPQRYSNFNWLNVTQNIGEGFYHKDISKDEKEQKIEDILQLLDLKGAKTQFVRQISGGMQQRVAIGRILAQDAQIIAMDEPFSALDFQTRENLQLLLKKINAETGKTIIFVTHDIEEALFIADKIILLSPAPSQIIQIYQPPFKKEHTLAIKTSKEFSDWRNQIESHFKNL